METYWLLGHTAIGHVQGQGPQVMINPPSTFQTKSQHEVNIGGLSAGEGNNTAGIYEEYKTTA
jgi:hypothetical protein